MERRLLEAIMFSPRGGSAHVARALSRRLVRLGWRLRLVSGSRSDAEGEADARRFYEGLEPQPVDFAPALAGEDPLDPPAGKAPIHPSFEERPDAPDPVFASLGDGAYEVQVEAWARALEGAGAVEADVLYLHHLTPINEAAARVAPEVPVVGHLHGTELLMLEQIERGAPQSWAHAGAWARRLREWASRCELLAVSPAGAERAVDLLGLGRERLLPLPNGFDPEVFHPGEVDRRALWRRHLVEEPSGWLPSGEVVGYRDQQLAPLYEGTVLLYVGRFTAVKRLPFLLEAFAEARSRFESPAGLVILGGHPGEWEGEHPAEAIARLGLEDAFLAGWRPQEALPPFLSAADAVILPSDREQFGQTLVEGMACGRPGIAADALAPSRILSDGESGWLFDPPDRGALARALIEAVNDPEERRRRGDRAREAALERFSWPTLAERLDQALMRAAASRSMAA